MRTCGRLWLFLAVTAASVVLGAAPRPAGADGEWVGKAAPPFEMEDLNGNPLKLTELLGRKKVVWLNFWGLRCSPCILELPALETIYRQYEARGLELIAVDTDGVDAEFIRKQIDAREDLKPLRASFPVAPDPEFAVIDAYGLMGAPLNMIIDKKGVIRFRHEGYEPGDEGRYVEVLEGLLAE
ncbi:MAG: TlpA disulfide reductase family protein [Thermodesulfobacteriota bacterium]